MKRLPFAIYWIPMGIPKRIYVLHYKAGGIRSATPPEVLMYKRLGFKITKAPVVSEKKK